MSSWGIFYVNNGQANFKSAFDHNDSYLKVLAVFIRHYMTTARAIQRIVNWNGELVRSKQTLARFCSKLEFSLALKIAKVVTAHGF